MVERAPSARTGRSLKVRRVMEKTITKMTFTFDYYLTNYSNFTKINELILFLLLT